ncbi:NUDIX hydrolase [Peloplasma aerotolerans]|uniref:NUDIX domain-containing protein n=1 Tax=Peloplasma aerotolerans TaxID=3044389 RepID=A0AAW6UAF0_9MOLU|nr:NUDIX domain-containing protein [Mariniplasma sp. M4Ah]MDI6452899.1 NUDIX domain-containing protein [Mariniplasma sp. M4Ah]
MIQFGPLIIEKGLIENGTEIKRNTVRAIITNEKKEVLLVYSKLFDDYTFPGGGVKPEETEIDALKRELKEEIGASDIYDIKACGQAQERKYDFRGTQNIYLQTSTYYICKVGTKGQQSLIGREHYHGIEPKWVDIDEAIQHNNIIMKDNRHQAKGLRTVLIRENMVLSKLKEIL